MLTFKELSEKKTKVKINPKVEDLKEKQDCVDCDCDQHPCIKCGKDHHAGTKSDLSQSVKENYASEKEISEERPEEVGTENLLTFGEATRLKKEKGYDKGGTKKPSGKKPKDAALAFVLDKIKKEHGKGAVMTGGSRQQKKVKGAKSDAGTGKYKKAADAKKQTAADAKKRGFKDVKNYVNTMARYGGKSNYDKGKGLGT